jgi:hypothetical protein
MDTDRIAWQIFRLRYWTGSSHIITGAALVGVIFWSLKIGLATFVILVAMTEIVRVKLEVLLSALLEAIQKGQTGRE